MRYLLHIHFQPSLAGLQQKRDETNLVALAGALLNYAPELKLNLSLSGYLLESLSERAAKELRGFSESARLELLIAPHYEANPALATAEDLEEQILLNQQKLSGLGFKNFRGIYLGGIPAAQLNLSSELSTLPLILSSKSEPLNTCVLNTGAKRLILTRLLNTERPLAGQQAAKPELQDSEQGLNTLVLNPALFQDNTLSGQRSELQKFLGILKSDLAKQTLCLSELAETSSAFITAQAEVSNTTPDVPQTLWLKRLSRLQAEIRSAPGLIAGQTRKANNEDHLKTAKAHYVQALAAILEPSPQALRKFRWNNIIAAQVALDSIRHPEVDPIVGWISSNAKTTESPTSDIEVYSQLLDVRFSPDLGAAILSLEYKPRKIELCARNAEQNYLSFNARLFKKKSADFSLQDFSELEPVLSSIPASANCLITRQTKDLFGLRATLPLELSPLKFELQTHYLIKCGIGAHRNNATTGLSLEYWLEGDKPAPSSFLAYCFCLALPSAEPASFSLRPLGAAGAERSEVHHFEQGLCLRNQDVEGGLNGARLIDGISGFFLDLRSAKPLNALLCRNIFDLESPREYQFTQLLFILDAARVYEDQRANTIFLSI